MKRPTCDAQHTAPRLGAENHYSLEVGKTCDFDWQDVAAEESPAEILADEIHERWGGRQLSPAVALEIAVKCGAGATSVSDEVDRAVMFEFVRSVLKRVATATRSKFEAECILVALGTRESNHDSMRSMAAHYGVTVAAISKRVREIAETYELPLTTFNKSAAASAGYKLTNGKRKKS